MFALKVHSKRKEFTLFSLYFTPQHPKVRLNSSSRAPFSRSRLRNSIFLFGSRLSSLPWKLIRQCTATSLQSLDVAMKNPFDRPTSFHSNALPSHRPGLLNHTGTSSSLFLRRNRRNHHIWNYIAADLYSPFAADFTLHS